MKLNRKILEVQELTEVQTNQMFNLMDLYYENSRLDTFRKDLLEKDWALLFIEEQSGDIVGFSTQKLIPIHHHGETVLILYSGDTIIAKEYWGSMELCLCFGELMLRLIHENPDKNLYWLLISKGLRTYKYLPTFFIDFYPSYDKKTPDSILELMNQWGTMYFPETYNNVKGIVHAKVDGQFLKQEYQPEPNPKKPHELFFYKANPGYYKGDELVCMAQLSMDNINSFIKRILNNLEKNMRKVP